jgi:hypothetical protein
MQVVNPEKTSSWEAYSCHHIITLQAVCKFQVHIMQFQNSNKNLYFRFKLLNSVKIPCARSPGCLTFLWWQLTYSVQLPQPPPIQMYQFTYTKQKASGKCDSSVQNLVHVTFLAPRIWRWLLDFCKNCGHSILMLVAMANFQFGTPKHKTTDATISGI